MIDSPPGYAFRRMAAPLALAACTLVAGPAQGESSGIGMGVAARGVAERETVDGGESRTRYYNVVEPWADVLFAYPALRFEAAYQPVFYLPVRSPGKDAYGETEPRVFHTGRLALTSTPTRNLELSLHDELRAVPLRYGAPIEPPDELLQTNEARAAARWERGRTWVAGVHGEGRRLDAFEGIVGETDRDGDGVVDPDEDLDGDGAFDTALRPSFSEAGGGLTLGRRFRGATRVVLTGGAGARVFDELSRNDHVHLAGGVEATRRTTETMDAKLVVLLRQYRFEEGTTFDGYEASGSLSWSATRVMSFGAMGSARRTVDVFASRADLAEAEVTGRRELARGASLEARARIMRARLLPDSNASQTRDIDAGIFALSGSIPVRWGVRVDTGYRFWRGGGGDLPWRTDHLFFAGLSWQ